MIDFSENRLKVAEAEAEYHLAEGMRSVSVRPCTQLFGAPHPDVSFEHWSSRTAIDRSIVSLGVGVVSKGCLSTYLLAREIHQGLQACEMNTRSLLHTLFHVYRVSSLLLLHDEVMTLHDQVRASQMQSTLLCVAG